MIPSCHHVVDISLMVYFICDHSISSTFSEGKVMLNTFPYVLRYITALADVTLTSPSSPPQLLTYGTEKNGGSQTAR